MFLVKFNIYFHSKKGSIHHNDYDKKFCQTKKKCYPLAKQVKFTYPALLNTSY